MPGSAQVFRVRKIFALNWCSMVRWTISVKWLKRNRLLCGPHLLAVTAPSFDSENVRLFFFFFSGHHVHGSSCLCVRSCEFGVFFYQSGGIWKVHDEVSGTAEWHSPAGRLPVGRHTAEIFTPALTNPSHAVVALGTPGRNAAPRHFCALLDPWHCKATVTPETCSEESTYKRLRAV